MCGHDAAITPVVCTSGLEIENLPQFDPIMSSLALLKPEIASPLDVKGKNSVDVFLPSMVAVVAFPFCMDGVKVMVVRMVPFLNKR